MGILIALVIVLNIDLPKCNLSGGFRDGLSSIVLLTVIAGIVLAAVMGRSSGSSAHHGEDD